MVSKERRRRGRHQLPDEVYLVMETAIDEILTLIEEEQGEDVLHNRHHHFIDREFRFMLRDRIHEERTKKGKDNK